MMFDRITNQGISRGLSPVAAGTDNTAYVSTILDLQDKHAAAFVTLIGANTDADVTFTALLEHGDVSNLSDAAAVPDAELILNEASASFTFADDNEVRKLGYKGSKRYIRYTITPANNAAGNIFIAGVWLWEGKVQPVAQPT